MFDKYSKLIQFQLKKQIKYYITGSRMTMDNTVKEFDDVGKVHAVIDDNLSVVLDKCESYK